MLTTEDTLLAAIREDPENPTVWSVYADWLQSQGDPNGELIALELERDRCTVDLVRRNELSLQIRQLERPDGGIDARLDVDDAMLPGLVDRVRRTVIRTLSITQITELGARQVASLVDALAYMPLRLLHVEAIASGPLRKILAACPRLKRIGCHRATPEQAGAIAQAAPHLIQFYGGRSSKLGDAGLEALAAIPALREVDAQRAGIGPPGIAALLDRIPVEKLVLRGNPIGDAGVGWLCLASSLRELELVETGFTAASLAAIAQAPALANLRRLCLGTGGTGRSNLAPSDLAVLIDSPHLSRELILEVDGYALGLESEYHQRDYAPEFDGLYWTSKPTGPLAERFRIEVAGMPG